MAKKMLIDATQPEETRVAIVDQERLEEFDYETSTKKQVKSNIYLAKVVRIEPSLQAAFVDYGQERHGFLSFTEIHPDYFQIPVDDRRALIAATKASQNSEVPSDDISEEETEQTPEELSGNEDTDIVVDIEEDLESSEDSESGDDGDFSRKTLRLHQRYKIQEVLKRHQVILVQVVKEERGHKGAALTTYISLAGRYCVLMPNTLRRGGVSRKISDVQDRQRLKEILDEVALPENMGAIVRTAGIKSTKAEIKKDLDYLQRLWDNIREETLQSTAPNLVHAEGDLMRRCLRDMYSKDISQIIIAGEEGYKTAQEFMRMLAPSHVKRIELYRAKETSLFSHYKIEKQINDMYLPRVQLRSGGSLIIGQTEALVAIDVNSGRSTRERHITDTALKTNIEAAEEVARQLRLRDLAGLIVIDFIDMDDTKHRYAVERKLRDALRRDRARVQIGHISSFGLLEMSRQRLRPSLSEAHSIPCAHCHGSGWMRSTESVALQILRHIEGDPSYARISGVTLFAKADVAFYLLNNKRNDLTQIEARKQISIVVQIQPEGSPEDWRLEKTQRTETVAMQDKKPATLAPESDASAEKGGTDDSEASPRRRRHRSRRGGAHRTAQASISETSVEVSISGDENPSHETSVLIPEVVPPSEEKPRRRHKRPLFAKDRARHSESEDPEQRRSELSSSSSPAKIVSFEDNVTVIEPIADGIHPTEKRQGWWQKWI